MADSEEVDSASPQPQNAGDYRAETEYAESGLPKIVDERLTLRAAAWQRGRWDTNATEAEILARIAARGGEATLKELITLNAIRHAKDKSSKLNFRAGRTGIQMEGQNQRDELAALNAGSDPAVHGAAPAAPNEVCSAMDASVPDAAAG